MARRRAPVRAEPADQETEEAAQESQEEVADEEMGEDDDAQQIQKRLRFREPLSWQPAKPISTALLLTRLEKLAKELSEFDQGEVELDSLKDVASKLGHRNLLQHKDRGVKAHTACCLVEILRLFVPEAPFTNDQLKMIFALLIRDILPALHDPTNPYDSEHKYVLESLKEVKSILLIGEIDGADDLMLRLFNSTFDGVSNNSKAASEDQIAKDVEINLTRMLIFVIDESPGSVPASVIDAIISQFLRAAPPGGTRSKEHSGGQSTLLLKDEPPAYTMAKNICNGCADKMSRYVSQYFSDVILNASGFATKPKGHRQGDDSDDEDANAGPSEADLKSLRQAHTLIREIWRAAPTILQNVVPQIEAELSADNVHLRQLATETVGDMISGIGAAGPPPPPVFDPTLYPQPRWMDESVPQPQGETNVLTNPSSPQSFAQTHPVTYRNFVGRRQDKAGIIRAAWTTACGYILATSAGGIGLGREEEAELTQGLSEKLNDSEERVRLAAVKAIELFNFRDIILKLGSLGGVKKEGSIFASLADRCRDRRPAIRVDAMVLLGKLWAVGAGEIAEGQQAVISCLSDVPSRIINVFYTNDPDLTVLMDRVLYECLVPINYPNVKGKAAKGAPGSQGKGGMSQAEQDRIRAERVLLMFKSLDDRAQRAIFIMQSRQPQFAKTLNVFIQQCEKYNGGVIEENAANVKAKMNQIVDWFGKSFPDPLKVRSDLLRFAKMNDRRAYSLAKYATEAEHDFTTVRRAIKELIGRIPASASGSLDTLIPLLYRCGSLMFNRSHLTTIMDFSKSDKDEYSSVAHQILNALSQQNPDLFKAHSVELRKQIVDQAPTESRTNDPSVVDILKAYSSYAKKYPQDVGYDRGFVQVLTSYVLYGTPPKAAKYAVNILQAKNDDKSKVAATNLLQKIMKQWDFGSPNFLNRLTAVSQLERLAPTVVMDHDDAIHDLTIKKILRQVRSEDPDPSVKWVDDADMDEELQAKMLSLKILVNQVIANVDEPDAEKKVQLILKLLKTFVFTDGEFCKTKDTPTRHRKRLRLLAGQLILKLCSVKKYDDQLDPASFNKLAELVQDETRQVRDRFMEKLQSYLTRGKLRPRFYTILYLVAFEPVTELKARVETWIRSQARYFSQNKKLILEAAMGRLIPLLAHHPDYDNKEEDLLDFANYFLFYLNTTATEENISLIYKYAERVKQTRDGLDPEASENLYVLSDLGQSVIRKYQERKGWSFQAWPDKVGLPTGLYTALPTSEVAQQIAKRQYISEDLDTKLDNLLRTMDKKKKRKSVHEWGDPPSKKPRTQIKAAIRQKPQPKPKITSKKPTAAKKPSQKPKTREEPLTGERRRSGRSHVVSNYAERADEDDEEEMLDGVAEWEYEGGSDSDGEPAASGESADDGAGEEDDPATKSNGRAAAKRKATTLHKSRSSRSGRGAAKGGYDDFEVDEE